MPITITSKTFKGVEGGVQKQGTDAKLSYSSEDRQAAQAAQRNEAITPSANTNTDLKSLEKVEADRIAAWNTWHKKRGSNFNDIGRCFNSRSLS